MGADREGTVSAFAIHRADGKLELLDSVPSGGAGPTFVSVHPSGQFVFVANYFGGTVAVLPILADGRLGAATDIKSDAGNRLHDSIGIFSIGPGGPGQIHKIISPFSHDI